jgi:hypothetical protein
MSWIAFRPKLTQRQETALIKFQARLRGISVRRLFRIACDDFAFVSEEIEKEVQHQFDSALKRDPKTAELSINYRYEKGIDFIEL